MAEQASVFAQRAHCPAVQVELSLFEDNPEMLAVCDEYILTSDGRTLAQAALGALWARSERIIPIPGFKTVAQVRENAGALQYGPLSPEQMRAIAEVLASSESENDTEPS